MTRVGSRRLDGDHGPRVVAPWRLQSGGGQIPATVPSVAGPDSRGRAAPPRTPPDRSPATAVPRIPFRAYYVPFSPRHGGHLRIIQDHVSGP